jgi:hypothetical protein
LSGGERDKEIDGGDLPRDDALGAQVSRRIAKDLLQLCPFCELVLDDRLDHLLLYNGLVLLPV